MRRTHCATQPEIQGSKMIKLEGINTLFKEFDSAAWVVGAMQCTVQSYFVGLVEQNLKNSDTDMIHARYLRLGGCKEATTWRGE